MKKPLNNKDIIIVYESNEGYQHSLTGVYVDDYTIGVEYSEEMKEYIHPDLFNAYFLNEGFYITSGNERYYPIDETLYKVIDWEYIEDEDGCDEEQQD